MPPHHHHHHGGGGGWGWGGYPTWGGDSTTVIVGDPGCIGYDPAGRTIRVPCTDVLGDDDERPLPPAPIMRTAFNVANGRKRGGSTPYFQFAAQARSYPFDWHGRPGGVPQSRVAGETRELSGGGDLLESGLNPYAQAWPPVSHRGFRLREASALSGLDLSNRTQQLGLAAAAGAAFLLWRKLRKRRGR